MPFFIKAPGKEMAAHEPAGMHWIEIRIGITVYLGKYLFEPHKPGSKHKRLIAVIS